MHRRAAATALMLAGVFQSGCSLPRGPINFDPLIPRWISHRELSCDCPPDDFSLEGQTVVDPSAVLPPHPRFHPVPTRPVFEPASAPEPYPLGL